VRFQDWFFSQEPKDGPYWSKRDKGIIISFACNEPAQDSCFCILTGGPCLEKDDGFDLQFIDLGKTYLVEVGTKKAEEFLKKYKKFFTPADKNIQDKKHYLKEACAGHFSKKYDIMQLHEKLKNMNLQALWEELGRRCTNCGGCEFICPTCFCFYTQDIEHTKGKGERIRAWDSCCFSGYSRMSGDNNPHEKNSERIRRRFFCKLYNCFRWSGMFGCTGCGRCSFVCPVNLDMESFIASLMVQEKYQPLLKEL
jgi:ferredoxin